MKEPQSLRYEIQYKKEVQAVESVSDLDFDLDAYERGQRGLGKNPNCKSVAYLQSYELGKNGAMPWDISYRDRQAKRDSVNKKKAA